MGGGGKTQFVPVCSPTFPAPRLLPVSLNKAAGGLLVKPKCRNSWCDLTEAGFIDSRSHRQH